MSEIRQYELLEDLRNGGKARASLLRWNGQAYVRTSDEIEIHEFVGTHGHRGDRGYTCFSEESQCWEAVSGLFEQAASWLPS